MAVIFDSLGVDVIQKINEQEFDVEEAGKVVDLELQAAFRIDQSRNTAQGLQLITKVSEEKLAKAEHLKLWFDMGEPDRYMKAVGRNLLKDSLDNILKFILDPATGIAKNPTIARNLYVLPFLAAHDRLWNENLSEAERAERKKKAIDLSETLAEGVSVFSTASNIQQLLSGLKTPKEKIEGALKKHKLSLKTLDEEKSPHKRLKAIRVLREIKKAELVKEAELARKDEVKTHYNENQLVNETGDMSAPHTATVAGEAKFDHRNVMIGHERMKRTDFPRAMRISWKNSWVTMRKFDPEYIAKKIQLLAVVRRRHNAVNCALLTKGAKPTRRQMCQFLRMTQKGKKLQIILNIFCKTVVFGYHHPNCNSLKSARDKTFPMGKHASPTIGPH